VIMRTKVMFAVSAFVAVLLVRNLYETFLTLPDEALQGAIYRILFFHAPAAWTFMVGAFVSMVASVVYLTRRSFEADALAASATEVALVFGAINLDEPTQRARLSAVLSILTFPGVVITYKAIEWWRTQHPGPVLSFRTEGQLMDPAMEQVLYLNFLAILLFAVVLTMIRIRQEETRRELDGLRREAHAI
jgi:heme exporter protein C